MDTNAAAWEKALDMLHGEVDEIQFLTWFKPLKPIIAGDDRMIFEVADTFVINVLRSRFFLMIKNAVMLSFGKEYQIEFLKPGEYQPPVVSKPAETAQRAHAAMLNPKYTFDTFVIGASNRFAHAASLAVAELPADAYNPLFLYGGVGLGKTHLMHAIGHYILKNNPTAKLMYITSETFTNQLISAIKSNANEEFRDRLRNVDVLMIDDIQFIAGKDATQEEFFHTFNALHSGGKQIVISSDRPPKEIPTLEERLRSRFEWGLIADIGRPDYETRIAILRRKAELERIIVGDDVLDFIAQHIDTNIRELEGSLTRVNAMAMLNGGQISLEVARQALQNIMPSQDKHVITPEAIIEACATHFGLTREDLLSARRNREIANTRQIAMFLIREMTQLSTTRIGEAFGGRDHTTVMHACDKVEKLQKTDAETADALALLRKALLTGR